MELDKEKYELLSKCGYISHFNRAIYHNRKTKKIFSIEAIEDHDMEWLRSSIDSLNKTGSWQMFFNGPAEKDIIQGILKELGE